LSCLVLCFLTSRLNAGSFDIRLFFFFKGFSIRKKAVRFSLCLSVSRENRTPSYRFSVDPTLSRLSAVSLVLGSYSGPVWPHEFHLLKDPTNFIRLHYILHMELTHVFVPFPREWKKL
jgi:hypothetical protein